MARKKKQQRIDTTSSAGSLTSSPFAALGGLRDALPEEETRPRPDEAAPPPASAPRRAVIRFQRKGRGGKDVTLVEKLGLAPGEQDRWLKQLKGQLGCGGTVEGDVLVLQGDQRERLPDLLTGRGVGKVSVS